MNHLHETINYIEIPSGDLEKTKHFFQKVFSWTFQDYGPEYIAFQDSAIEGGFYKSNLVSRAEQGSVLVVFYSENLEKTMEKIVGHGGSILKPIFDFPGGRRFHFADPTGNEFAVWGEA